MAATCITQYNTIICCDGTFVTDRTLILGPETEQASAMAYIDGHGAVCTGMGNVASGIDQTCRAGIETLYRWTDV